MFFVVSLGYVFCLFGLGYFVTYPLCLKRDHSPFVEKIPLVLVTGLLVNHLILLLGQSLKLSLLVGAGIAGCGLVWFLIRWKKEVIFSRYIDYVPSAGVILILFLYYVSILYEPLREWDARSIWFFHSKMIWSAGSLNMAAGWNHPSLLWSHVDYPKLIAALGAQLSYMLGYWNEYAPKFSLFLLLMPAILWLFSFYARRFSFLFLVLIFPFGLKTHLWNGFMDGYIALYSAVSVLLIGRYYQERRSIDLLSAISCLVLMCNIKNEGILIGLLGAMSIIVTAMLSTTFKFRDFKNTLSAYRAGWLVLIISPGVLWSVVYKHKWHLMNDLQIGTLESVYRLSNRISDGVSFPLILKKTFFHSENALWLALALFFVCIIWLALSKRRIVSWIPAFFIATVYYFCILIIYLTTPQDLTWHLNTSADRIMLTVGSCLMVGSYYILKELENASI